MLVLLESLSPKQRAVESLLAHDVQLTGDGGGRAPALARTLRGRSRVARVLSRWLSTETRLPGIRLRPTEINGDPACK